MKTRVMVIVAAAGLLAGTAWTLGQVYQRQGNVLDANPRQGSAGLNMRSPVYNPNLANRMVTGNVTGGASFRGFSPIRSPNSMFLGTPGGIPTDLAAGSALPSAPGVPIRLGSTGGLPSDRLLTFSRDSIDIADVQEGTLGSTWRPYYSPWSTVTSAGGIGAGLNRPGTSPLRSPYALPEEGLRVRSEEPILPELAQRTGATMQVPTQLIRVGTGQPITGPVNLRLLGNPLFSGVQRIPVTALAAQAEKDGAGRASAAEPLDLRAPGSGLVDGRVDGRGGGGATIKPVGSVLDQVLARTDRRAAREGRPAAQQPDRWASRAKPSPTESLDGTASVFDRTRAASNLLVGPIGSPVGSGGAGPPSGPTLARPIAPEAAPEAARPGAVPSPATLAQRKALAEAVAAAPLKTFVGTEESRINQCLDEGEKQLRAGNYYEAAGWFDLARVVDLSDPRPLVARSMALLMAGDYMTSANNLFMAFMAVQRFEEKEKIRRPGNVNLDAIAEQEELALFNIDLKAFVSDPSALDRRRADLDRRRADLEARLERFEDFRLRFLLGFAEWCSGLEEGGLKNLETAAAAAPQDMTLVRRFVEILKQRQAGKPESTRTEEPAAPAGPTPPTQPAAPAEPSPQQ